jgi:hypothetical protein
MMMTMTMVPRWWCGGVVVCEACLCRAALHEHLRWCACICIWGGVCLRRSVHVVEAEGGCLAPVKVTVLRDHLIHGVVMVL